MGAVTLNGFGETDYIDSAVRVFCTGYLDADAHIGIALSPDNANVWSLYGRPPGSMEGPCSMNQTSCSTWSIMQALMPLVERLSPTGIITILFPNNGVKKLVKGWTEGCTEPAPWMNVACHQFTPVQQLFTKAGDQVSTRYVPTRRFVERDRVWKLRDEMGKLMNA